MSAFSFELLADGVGGLTINRADRRNALSVAMRREMFQLLRSEEVQGLRALVLSSEGTVFSAGADLKDPQGMDPRNVSSVADLLLQLRRCPPVLVAAVQGPALGLGAGLALTCDLVVAAPEASFGYPEINHGLVASMTVVGLVQYLGTRKAFELLITGDPMSAEQALEHGMINEIVPQSEVNDRALALALRVASRRDMAVHTAKRFFYETLDVPYAVGMRSAERVSELVRVQRRLDKATET